MSKIDLTEIVAHYQGRLPWRFWVGRVAVAPHSKFFFVSDYWGRWRWWFWRVYFLEVPCPGDQRGPYPKEPLRVETQALCTQRTVFIPTGKKDDEEAP